MVRIDCFKATAFKLQSTPVQGGILQHDRLLRPCRIGLHGLPLAREGLAPWSHPIRVPGEPVLCQSEMEGGQRNEEFDLDRRHGRARHRDTRECRKLFLQSASKANPRILSALVSSYAEFDKLWAVPTFKMGAIVLSTSRTTLDS